MTPRSSGHAAQPLAWVSSIPEPRARHRPGQLGSRNRGDEVTTDRPTPTADWESASLRNCSASSSCRMIASSRGRRASNLGPIASMFAPSASRRSSLASTSASVVLRSVCHGRLDPRRGYASCSTVTPGSPARRELLRGFYVAPDPGPWVLRWSYISRSARAITSSTLSSLRSSAKPTLTEAPAMALDKTLPTSVKRRSASAR